MKKLFLLAATALIALGASAQFTIAPEAGFQMTKFTGKTDGETVNADMKAGFRVGANVDYAISDHIHIQGGLFYSLKGYKASQDVPLLGKIDLKTSINYLEVPFYVNYMTGEEGGNRFFVGIGPYLAYALSGKNDLNGTKEDIKFGSDKDKDEMKRLDIGGNINVGYMLSNGIYARAHYGMGFVNLNPAGNSDNTMKAMGFGISVGYVLGSGKRAN